MGRVQEFSELLIQTAKEEGFPLAGVLDLELAASFQNHISRYDQWISKGYAGSMEYLVRGRDRRSDPRLAFPGAKSILCVGLPYDPTPAGNLSPSEGPRYARYLRKGDYHSEIADKLERVMTKVSSSYPVRWKVCVDTSAVLERSWAALAGLGWIGKNTLLIHPQFGSYFFLGEVLIDRETGRSPNPLSDYCGNCTRCLDSCPTSAFPESHTLNSNRCISYWTLEKRGVLNLSEQDRHATGSWIAGCDLCQEVCPFNTKPSKRAEKIQEQGDIGDATQLKNWFQLLTETETDYQARVKNSSLRRVKPAQFRRNLAIALSNTISQMSEEVVNQIKPLVIACGNSETDDVAKSEWNYCLLKIELRANIPR